MRNLKASGNMSVKVEMEFSAEEVVARLKKVVEEVKQLALRLAEEAKDLVFELAPEKTGALKQSIELIETPDSVEIIVTKPCAASAERRAGFFYQAVKETQEKLPQYLQELERQL